MRLAIFGGVLVAVLALYLLARPWLVRNGWLFPKGQAGSAGKALLNVHALLEPSKRHVIEWQQLEEQRRDDDESGSPPDPGDDAIG